MKASRALKEKIARIESLSDALDAWKSLSENTLLALIGWGEVTQV